MGEEARKLTGGCLCGAIRYRAEGPPKRVSNCHCSMCRRANGAAFATAAAFDPAKLTFTKGAPTAYASSAKLERLFCPACGSSVGFRYRDREAHRRRPAHLRRRRAEARRGELSARRP